MTMFRKAKSILIAVLLLLILVQSTGYNFIPGALAASPTGQTGDLKTVDNSTPVFNSANGNNQNPPSTKTAKQNDDITYKFKVTRDLVYKDYIVLGFDADEQSGKQYNLRPANVPQTVISANPSWIAGPNEGRLDPNSSAGTFRFVQNSNCRVFYGSANSRCVIIGPGAENTIPANTNITITLRVENPGGDANAIHEGTGWYPVGVRIITQAENANNVYAYNTHGTADDRIKVGTPSQDRPDDIAEVKNDCAWNNIPGCFYYLLDVIAGILFNALADLLAVVLKFFTSILIHLASYFIAGATFVNTMFIHNMSSAPASAPDIVPVMPQGNPKAEAAYIGFNIMLGLTNIGFIIAIIVIAFATMLRRENYGLSALPRLIIIALIINFSMFIAVSVIDVSNRVAGGFSSVVAGPGQNNWAETFNKFFSNVTTDCPEDNPEITCPRSSGGFGAAVNKLVKVLMAFIMGMLAFFVLTATAIMLIIRYLFLTFLIILLPLALLSKIFPNLKTPDGGNHWNKWQSSFTEWVIFYPIVMLFISIAVYMANWFSTPGQSLSDNSAYGIFAGVIQSIIICGIMIGGIMVAKKFGLAGADYANNVGSWATRRITGKAAGLGLRGIGAAGRGLGSAGRGVRNLGGAIKQTGKGGAPGTPSSGGQPQLQTPAVFPKIPMAGAGATGTMADLAPEMEKVGAKIGVGAGKTGGAGSAAGVAGGVAGVGLAVAKGVVNTVNKTGDIALNTTEKALGAIAEDTAKGEGATAQGDGGLKLAPGATINAPGANINTGGATTAGANATIGGMKGPEQQLGGAQPSEDTAPTEATDKDKTFRELFPKSAAIYDRGIRGNFNKIKEVPGEVLDKVKGGTKDKWDAFKEKKKTITDRSVKRNLALASGSIIKGAGSMIKGVGSGLSKAEGLGNKVDKWGKSGPSLWELTKNEVKKRKGPFGGLIEESHSKKHEEDKKEEEIKKLTDQFQTAEGITDKKIARAKAEIQWQANNNAKTNKKAAETMEKVVAKGGGHGTAPASNPPAAPGGDGHAH